MLEYIYFLFYPFLLQSRRNTTFLFPRWHLWGSGGAWGFISRSRRSAVFPLRDLRSCPALQTADGRFGTITVKMLHGSVKTNENKRAACSNRRDRCLFYSFFSGSNFSFKIHSKMQLRSAKVLRLTSPRLESSLPKLGHLKTFFLNLSFQNSLWMNVERAH